MQNKIREIYGFSTEKREHMVGSKRGSPKCELGIGDVEIKKTHKFLAIWVVNL